MKRQKVTRTDVLFLSISVFIVVCASIGFNIYHSWVTTTITPELQQQIIPIEASFDTQTINALRSRQELQALMDADQRAVAVTPTAVPQPNNIQPTFSFSQPNTTVSPLPTIATSPAPTAEQQPIEVEQPSEDEQTFETIQGQ